MLSMFTRCRNRAREYKGVQILCNFDKQVAIRFWKDQVNTLQGVLHLRRIANFTPAVTTIPVEINSVMFAYSVRIEFKSILPETFM